MKIILALGLLAILAGCQTSQHRPVAFKTDTEVECPEWAVLADVEGRFYCIDRRVLEEGGPYYD